MILSLSAAVASVASMPLPAGLGAEPVLREHVQGIATAVSVLHAQLAVRMAALEQQDRRPSDVVGEAVRAGITVQHARTLRRLGIFARSHPELQTAWLSGSITFEQVGILHKYATKLSSAALRGRLVEVVLPELPPLDARATARAVAYAADQLQPDDPDQHERSDSAARYLRWGDAVGGGIALDGYLPPAEAARFKAAITALAESLRVAGDGCTPDQRRADALSAMVDIAGSATPTVGGTAATLTLTVNLQEAERVALRDPAAFATGYTPRPRGSATIGGPAGEPAGDAVVRFGLCCAEITPLLHAQPAPRPGSLADRIANTSLTPLAMGRSVRTATVAQRKALQARDGGCAIPGCTIGAPFTEAHHVVGWALGGPTDLDQLVSLCWVHHMQTELGMFRFIPRHPGDDMPIGALEHPLWWIMPPLA